MSTALTSIIISYLLGSIPSGVIITKCFNLGEIRNIGSGSTGATNVLRTGNYLASALTLLFDVLKAIVAVKICQFFYPDKFFYEIFSQKKGLYKFLFRYSLQKLNLFF